MVIFVYVTITLEQIEAKFNGMLKTGSTYLFIIQFQSSSSLQAIHCSHFVLFLIQGKMRWQVIKIVRSYSSSPWDLNNFSNQFAGILSLCTHWTYYPNQVLNVWHHSNTGLAILIFFQNPTSTELDLQCTRCELLWNINIILSTLIRNTRSLEVP